MSVSSSITSSEPAPRLRRLPARFLVVFVFALSLACGLAAAINVSVDPFGFFGLNRAGLYFDDERTFKLNQVKQYPHDALIFGDSRAAYIDPDAMTTPRFFNAAFGGARFDEMLWFWEHYEGDARVVVLTLLTSDFLGGSRLDEAFTRRSWRDYFRYTLSFELLERSIDTLRRWRKGQPPSYNDNGSRRAIGKQIDDLKWDPAGAPDSAKDGQAGDAILPEKGVPNLCAGYRPPPGPLIAARGLEWRFGRMVSLAQRRGTKLILMLHPRHQDQLKAGDYSILADPLLNYICQFGVDFFDYTHSEYSDPEGYWLTDHTHYKPEVGLRLLADVLRRGGVPVELK